MKTEKWLTHEQARLLRERGAPTKLVQALGTIPRTRHALLDFDFTQRYAVFVDILQQRSKGLAQRAVFEVVEALRDQLGEPRSMANFAGGQLLCREWRCVPGWALSVSAEFYSGDEPWCDVALIIHRRFPDEESRKLMDRHVKIALWGEDEDAWPRSFSPLVAPVDVPAQPEALPSWVVELEQAAGPASERASELEASTDRPSLEDLYLE